MEIKHINLQTINCQKKGKIMAEMLSPGVLAIEEDLSIIVPRVSSSIGAFAGDFEKGPVGDYRLITNTVELEDVFGVPTNANYNSWFQAKTFLDKADKLYISRAVDSNGSWQDSNVLIATAINEPAVGAPGINEVDISYSETDIVAGSFIRFANDANQRRYFVVKLDETTAPVFQSDDITIPAGPFNGTTAQADVVDFGAFVFPAAGGETFDFVTDSNTITYTAVAGDNEAEVIAGLRNNFNGQGITSVNFTAGTTTITMTSSVGGTSHAVVTAAGTNTNVTNSNTATDAEVFDIVIDGVVVSVEANTGDVNDDIIGALDAKFATVGINSVDFLADYVNHKIVVTSLEGGTAGAYTIVVSGSDTAGSVVTSVEVGSDGLATITLDMEIDWDLIPGIPGSKQIVTGANQIEYIYSIAVNALTEVKTDNGDYTPQVNELQVDLGTYSIGDTFKTDITEYDTSVTSVEYVVQDDGTGNPESRSKVIDGIYAAIVTSNIKSIETSKDNVIGKVVLTSKYPGLAYAFGTVTSGSSFIGTVTYTSTTTPATDGTLPVTEAELFSTRDIYYNSDDFELKEDSIKFSTNESKLKFISRWVGDEGNNINVTIAKSTGNPSGLSDFNQSVKDSTVVDVTSNGVRTVTTTSVSPILALPGIPLDGLFEYEPADDEIAIVVSVRGEIKERYIVSLDPTKKDYNGKSKYIEDIINSKSSYIYVKDNQEVTGLPESSVQQTSQTVVEQYQVSTGQKIGKSSTDITIGAMLNLVHGDSGVVGRDDLQVAYDVFKDKESLEVDILIANEESRKYVCELAKDRGDCIAFVGPLYEEVVGLKTSKAIDNMVDSVMSVFGDLNIENSYAAYFGNYLYVYDKWNDTMRWISPAGATAGMRAETNTNFQTWWASAGLLRGTIQGVDKLAFIPNLGQRDVLYKNKINPIASFPGRGNAVIWGNKTMLSRPSSFNRINVRGLFNTLKRAISKMALYYVFEINDEFTRGRFVEAVTPYLEWVKGNRGIYDFAIQCDESNNTPAVIDSNTFIASIFVKPARIAEFLELHFTAVGTGVEFKEVFA